uniref:Putative secreted protein n=1 Tax=Ixodes ricinus TaxID=34613 RepID=A0A147BKQ9_IXORI
MKEPRSPRVGWTCTRAATWTAAWCRATCAPARTPWRWLWQACSACCRPTPGRRQSAGVRASMLRCTGRAPGPAEAPARFLS